jgi:hypothetical protein
VQYGPTGDWGRANRCPSSPRRQHRPAWFHPPRPRKPLLPTPLPGYVYYYTPSAARMQSRKPATCSDFPKKPGREWSDPPPHLRSALARCRAFQTSQTTGRRAARSASGCPPRLERTSPNAPGAAVVQTSPLSRPRITNPHATPSAGPSFRLTALPTTGYNPHSRPRGRPDFEPAPRLRGLVQPGCIRHGCTTTDASPYVTQRTRLNNRATAFLSTRKEMCA